MRVAAAHHFSGRESGMGHERRLKVLEARLVVSRGVATPPSNPLHGASQTAAPCTLQTVQRMNTFLLSSEENGEPLSSLGEQARAVD